MFACVPCVLPSIVWFQPCRTHRTYTSYHKYICIHFVPPWCVCAHRIIIFVKCARTRTALAHTCYRICICAYVPDMFGMCAEMSKPITLANGSTPEEVYGCVCVCVCVYVISSCDRTCGLRWCFLLCQESHYGNEMTCLGGWNCAIEREKRGGVRMEIVSS